MRASNIVHGGYPNQSGEMSNIIAVIIVRDEERNIAGTVMSVRGFAGGLTGLRTAALSATSQFPRYWYALTGSVR